jgi:hypothetical protein
MSFREMALGVHDPRWFHDGASLLVKTQAQDGRWQENEANRVPDTAFALLFLLRSTKKSISKVRNFGDGTLVGGRGFPESTGDVHVRKGKVVSKSLLGPAERLLDAIENPETSNAEEIAELFDELTRKQADQLLGEHARKLRDMVGERSAKARLAAVSALGSSRDLDNVPVLIYALTDPDAQVFRAARDALRRVTRKPTGFGLGDKPDESELRVAIDKWKGWYLAIRPDAEFDN